MGIVVYSVTMTVVCGISSMGVSLVSLATLTESINNIRSLRLCRLGGLHAVYQIFVSRQLKRSPAHGLVGVHLAQAVMHHLKLWVDNPDPIFPSQ